MQTHTHTHWPGTVTKSLANDRARAREVEPVGVGKRRGLLKARGRHASTEGVRPG